MLDDLVLAGFVARERGLNPQTGKPLRQERFREVERKVSGLRRLTKASVRTALIYAGELAKSVPAEGYFDFLIPAERLLELPNSGD